MGERDKPISGKARTPHTPAGRPNDVKAAVDRVMDPNGDRAALEALRKERHPDGN